MDSISNPSYLAYELLNFANDTNLIEKNTNNNGYTVTKKRIEELTNFYLSNRYSNIPSLPKELNNLYKSNILKNCFNQCKKFVLEDWVDYKEIDCTLNCTAETINATKVLDSLY